MDQQKKKVYQIYCAARLTGPTVFPRSEASLRLSGGDDRERGKYLLQVLLAHRGPCTHHCESAICLFAQINGTHEP